MYKSLRPFELLEQLNGWPITREIYLSQLWRLGSPPRSRCWQMWCVVRAHFWFIDSLLLLCPHMAEGGRELSGASFIRALISYMKSSSS